jgi:hypothetical protein
MLIIVVVVWKRHDNAKQDLRALLTQIDAKALITIAMQRDQLAAVVFVDGEMLFAFQVYRRGSDDTAFRFGLCVDADGPAERECWTAWNLMEGRLCVTTVRRFWARERSGGQATYAAHFQFPIACSPRRSCIQSLLVARFGCCGWRTSTEHGNG